MPKIRRGTRGASHEKFHAAPSKKQARFLEGLLALRTQGKSDLLRGPFASKKVLRGTFRGLPPFAPLLEKPRERNSGEIFRYLGEKCGEHLAKNFSDFRPFNFQG